METLRKKTKSERFVAAHNKSCEESKQQHPRLKKIERTGSATSLLSASSKRSQKSDELGGYIRLQNSKPQTSLNQKPYSIKNITANCQNIVLPCSNKHKRSSTFLSTENTEANPKPKSPVEGPIQRKRGKSQFERVLLSRTDASNNPIDRTRKSKDNKENTNSQQSGLFPSKSSKTINKIASQQNQEQTSDRFKQKNCFKHKDDQFFERLNESSILEQQEHFVAALDPIQLNTSGFVEREDLSFDEQMQKVFESNLIQKSSERQCSSEECLTLRSKHQQLILQCEQLEREKSELKAKMEILSDSVKNYEFQLRDLQGEMQKKNNRIFDLEIKLKNGECQGSNRLVLQDQKIFELTKKNKDLADEIDRKEHNIQVLNEKLISCEDSEMELRKCLHRAQEKLERYERESFGVCCSASSSMTLSQTSSLCLQTSLNSTTANSLSSLQEEQLLEFTRNQLYYLQEQLQAKELSHQKTKEYLTEAEIKLSVSEAKFKKRLRKIEHEAEGRCSSLLSRQNELLKQLAAFKYSQNRRHLRTWGKRDEAAQEQEITLELSPDKKIE